METKQYPDMECDVVIAGCGVAGLYAALNLPTSTRVIMLSNCLLYTSRFYPSSKTCSACGYVYRGLTLAERVWDCPACGMRHDRDLNAAVNIAREGRRILEGTAGHAGTAADAANACGEGVRPTAACAV